MPGTLAADLADTEIPQQSYRSMHQIGLRACRALNGRLHAFVVVDFADLGDIQGTIRQLNAGRFSL